MSCNINAHILEYIEMVESGTIKACEEQILLIAHVRRCFESEDIYTDDEQLTNYLHLARYFPYRQLFPWQKFCTALHLCTYKTDGMPRWPDIFYLIGRGAGKDGTIAYQSACLISPYNGILQYDVDICANNEEQAMRPVWDVMEAFENPKHIEKLKKHFYWTKEKVISKKTKSVVRGRTNSPKGKDGLRSGIVVFNEIHQYENYDNINVFTTGLGKKRHPRRAYFTTNGDVREGPLDDLINTSDAILRGGEPDNGFLPFICKLNNKEDVHDEENWDMANPSLKYLPDLKEEIRKEYREWNKTPERLPAFITKRMNLPESKNEIIVTDWKNIKATCKTHPGLEGWNCVIGIDYMKVTDFASVNIHFRDGDQRYDINHSWLCSNSKDISRIKAPWRDWVKQKLITYVEDVEIHPDLIVDYIDENAQKYNILKVAMDDYRYALLSKSLKNIGFDAYNNKNLKLVRPSDIIKVVPIIDSCFANKYFAWGDNPVLRWAANNTKLVKAGSRAKEIAGNDAGNFIYGKIEPKSRKTDPFMALAASMIIEPELGDGGGYAPLDLPVYTY